MAKLTQPLGSSEARGALGGLVYGSWRGVSFVRTKVTPATQNTARQIAIRGFAASITDAWKNLFTDTDRRAWDTYAESHTLSDWTGSPKRLSGYNWFMKINVPHLDCGGPGVLVPPSIPAPPAIESLSAAPDSEHFHLSWADYPLRLGESYYLDIAVTPKLSPGRKPCPHWAIHNTYFELVNDSTPLPHSGPGRYGIYCRVIDFLAGPISPYVSLDVTVEP